MMKNKEEQTSKARDCCLFAAGEVFVILESWDQRYSKLDNNDDAVSSWDGKFMMSK